MSILERLRGRNTGRTDRVEGPDMSGFAHGSPEEAAAYQNWKRLKTAGEKIVEASIVKDLKAAASEEGVIDPDTSNEIHHSGPVPIVVEGDSTEYPVEVSHN